MFDLFEDAAFTDEAYEYFAVLHKGYFEDRWQELVPALQDVFNDMFDINFVIVDSDTCKPININAVLNDRASAEQCLKIIGKDKHSIALLLTEK